MKSLSAFLIFVTLGFSLSVHAELKFKDDNADYKFSKKEKPVAAAIEGKFSTFTETDWNARIEILPKGKLTVEIIVQDENMDKPAKNVKTGTWAIEKDLLVLKYDKGWIKYEFYPKTKTFIEKEPLDVLKPISASKEHLLKVQNLHRLPAAAPSKK